MNRAPATGFDSAHLECGTSFYQTRRQHSRLQQPLVDGAGLGVGHRDRLLVDVVVLLRVQAQRLEVGVEQVRRVDLATAISRLLALVGSARPELQSRWRAARPAIADVSAGHLNYPAVSLAVASGAMRLAAGDRFQLSRPVPGAEAIDAINRVYALAAPVN